MNARLLIGAALAATLPATSFAQEGLRPRSLIASAGVGSGSASFSCDACPGGMDAGVSFLLGVGVAVRPDLSVGIEASRWTKSYADTRGTADARILFVNLAAQWYPRAASPLFIKGGAGMASIADDVALTSLGAMDISSSGAGLVLGVGRHFDVARGWAVAPYLDLNYALKGTQSVNGAAAGQKLGGSMLHFGVAATRGAPTRRSPSPPPPMVATIDTDSIERERARAVRDSVVADSVARVRASEEARAALVAAIHFDLATSALRDDAKAALDAKAAILLANPDVRLRIVGHTDGRGSGETNIDLGQRRAAAAIEYLAARGVDAARVESVSRGAEQPVCTEQTEECWSRNRRIELEIVSGGAMLRAP